MHFIIIIIIINITIIMAFQVKYSFPATPVKSYNWVDINNNVDMVLLD